MRFDFLKIFSASIIFLLLGCKADDTELPVLKIPYYSEEFTNVQHNTILDLSGWINFNEFGATKWYERIFSGNGYAQFNPYGTTDVKSVAWLISPSITVEADKNTKFSFQSAQNFVSDDANTIEVYVSTNFDGTNVLAANWTRVQANIANKNTTGYEFISSGEIDLNSFKTSGKVNIAFRATGSGTNTNLDGLFQIDDLKVYNVK